MKFHKIELFLIIIGFLVTAIFAEERQFNAKYSGKFNNRIAFPVGGIGAGMYCVEGTGTISHMSVRGVMDFFNEPQSFAAICIKDKNGNTAKVLEGPVPKWKVYGISGTCNGEGDKNYGLPRFRNSTFEARFPFGIINLIDDTFPLKCSLNVWSPFIPGDANNSSLPVGAMEYSFVNTSRQTIEAVFSFNTPHFMVRGKGANSIELIQNGFVLKQQCTKEEPWNMGAFAAFTDSPAVVDCCWFKGDWPNPRTLAWQNIQEMLMLKNPPQKDAKGASLFVALMIKPGECKTVRLMTAWYVPHTDITVGDSKPQAAATASSSTAKGQQKVCCSSGSECSPSASECSPSDNYYSPWYAGRFADINEVADYWNAHYDDLRRETKLFSETFYDTTLPSEVVEAVAANLTILKTPTVLRQKDGKLWGWEGCGDNSGCCAGSCTHVWNYAQAISHLFPDLERSFRYAEFFVSQDANGFQLHRTGLPIRPILSHNTPAAADGQLGGIMKVFREWRISGDRAWLEEMWPQVKKSIDYCINTWDPRGVGILEEPQVNTYDIFFWGPNGHCSSFYLGALTAAVEMGKTLGQDVSRYSDLLHKGRENLETKLYNGEYFFQDIRSKGLNAKFAPLDSASSGPRYANLIDKVNEQGPLYQYGMGCLSDGVLGFWMARMCGMDMDIVDSNKIKSHLRAVYKYNLKHDLSEQVNTLRATYAVGNEGGLLICTWPREPKLYLPFVYSSEVWTGIEYSAASHMIMLGLTDEGLDIVRTCRKRYDGQTRNPFDEYECGHWYARAMSSYALIYALTGVRYDAVDKILYIDSRVGDNFRSFISTASGYGTVGLKKGNPFIEIKKGYIDIKTVMLSGKKASLK